MQDLNNATPPILLGSSSTYRAELLSRLGLPFNTATPDCDETPLANESPQNLAQRLATAKAQSLKNAHPNTIIIGSDQVAALGNALLGKPGSKSAAHQQLKTMRGQPVHFYTGLCVVSTASGHCLQAVDCTRVVLRDLSDAEIERYIDAEMPLDCAGSFKVEKLGISLFESVESKDPTALIGLPLIQLSEFLRQAGIALP